MGLCNPFQDYVAILEGLPPATDHEAGADDAGERERRRFRHGRSDHGDAVVELLRALHGIELHVQARPEVDLVDRQAGVVVVVDPRVEVRVAPDTRNARIIETKTTVGHRPIVGHDHRRDRVVFEVDRRRAFPTTVVVVEETGGRGEVVVPAVKPDTQALTHPCGILRFPAGIRVEVQEDLDGVAGEAAWVNPEACALRLVAVAAHRRIERVLAGRGLLVALPLVVVEVDDGSQPLAVEAEVDAGVGLKGHAHEDREHETDADGLAHCALLPKCERTGRHHVGCMGVILSYNFT
ncbi:MAG: hypothetical protein K0S38_804 [Candidatus Paceibacter sp.]|nr:hypothetical protein [Candidatus Paceibacter sp.]